MSKKQGYSLLEDFDPIFKGNVDVPNWEPIEDVARGVSNIAAGGGLHTIPNIVNIRLPGEMYTSRARACLKTAQFGGLTGEGYLMVDMSGIGKIGRFAICKHEFVSEGGNPLRGWRPGHCGKCGLNMSVDSGD